MVGRYCRYKNRFTSSLPAILANKYLVGKITINFKNCNGSILYMVTVDTNLDFEHLINPSSADELSSSTGNNARLVSGTKTSPNTWRE